MHLMRDDGLLELPGILAVSIRGGVAQLGVPRIGQLLLFLRQDLFFGSSRGLILVELRGVHAVVDPEKLPQSKVPSLADPLW